MEYMVLPLYEDDGTDYCLSQELATVQALKLLARKWKSTIFNIVDAFHDVFHDDNEENPLDPSLMEVEMYMVPINAPYARPKKCKDKDAMNKYIQSDEFKQSDEFISLLSQH